MNRPRGKTVRLDARKQGETFEPRFKRQAAGRTGRPKVFLFAPALVLLMKASLSPAATEESFDLASLGDACGLISQEELSDAIGEPMSPGDHLTKHVSSSMPSGTKQCTWRALPEKEGDPPHWAMQIYLDVIPLTSGRFKAPDVRATQSGITNVPGLGDDAYFYVFFGTGGTLDVKMGDIIIEINSIYRGDPQTVMNIDTTIATRVISKLQRR